MASLINVTTKKVAKRKVEDEFKQKNRCLTYTYHLQVSRSMIPICKSCFQITFNESSKFITNVILSKNTGTSRITYDDKRGTHEPWHKIPDEVKEAARKHILSLPAYETHYYRHQTTKKYLPPHYTFYKIYEEYVKQENVNKAISKKNYAELFHEEKTTIKRLQKDTCQTCDKLHIKINSATELNKETLQQELSDHQNSCKDDNSKRIYTFDLQQCLPTPDVVTSYTFYKRQPMTFNLSLHDCVSKQAYCHTWHEVIARRGANQVGSCLYSHLISNIPPEVKQVILYSDTYGGQNKNSHLVAMFFTP
ncbi:hypothetical protein RN001_002045 [Aquatica leii]|uniref:Uncharacterized protein n=1 Tax=Aquatica leii TaxID=1421715 RepID=A0AAN7PGK5_9COLE|nr:hypothetical protein RN001_002045 [Aquatica leii]